MALDSIPHVLVSDLGDAVFENGMLHLHGTKNGLPVIYAMAPNTAIKGVAAVQRAILGSVVPWPAKRARRVTGLTSGTIVR